MPRIKPTDRVIRIANINSVIEKYKMMNGITTHDEISAILGYKSNNRMSYLRLRKNPEKWTISQIDTLIRVLHIPKWELVSAFYGESDT